MKKMAKIFTIVLIVLMAVACVNRVPVVIPSGNDTPSVTKEEAAVLAGSYVDSIDGEKLTNVASSLISNYGTAAINSLTEKYTEYEDGINYIKTGIENISSQPMIGIAAILQGVGTIYQAGFFDDMPNISALMETLYGESTTPTIDQDVIDEISKALKGDDIWVELGMKANEILSVITDNTVSESGNYSMTISDPELTDEAIGNIIKCIILPEINNLTVNAGEGFFAINIKFPEFFVENTEAEPQCDVDILLTLAITSNTMNSDIFKDGKQYAGTVYMTINLKAIRALVEDFSDYDFYANIENVVVDTNDNPLSIRLSSSSPAVSLALEEVIAPIGLYADYETSKGLTIEKDPSGTPAEIKKISDIFDFKNSSGTVTYDGVNMTFQELLVNTAQGRG